MAVLATTNLTLADWAKRLDPQGKTPDIVELLAQTNEILSDAVFKEGNLATGHRLVIRTGLPVVYWRALNAGVPNSKSTTATVDETVGMLEAYSEVDVDLATLNGNTAAFRLSEDQAFLEAMNQTQAQTLFYGNPGIDPKQYLGLAPRYSTISGATNGQNIIDAGGVQTDNTSIWLVVWGDNTVFCPYPKGSMAGVQHRDLGEDTVKDANGGQFQAYRTHYQWKNGLAVKDWRYVVRICNIDVSNVVTETGAADLFKLMSRAISRIPNLAMGRPVFYMNRTIESFLPIQGMTKTGNVLTVQEGLSQFGGPTVEKKFLGIPVRKVDQIFLTEARVV
jgi:hypothetical protein